MKKRIFSILLALCMVLTFMPTVAFADGEPTTTSAPTGTALTQSDVTSGTLSLSDNTSYYLNGDVTISKTIEINGTVTLDLNGHVLKMTGSGSVIKVESTGNLTLKDSDSDNKHTGTTLPDGGVITGGTGNKIENTLMGGGVYNEGTFIMKGGNIAACRLEDAKDTMPIGGGVYNKGKFTMTSGSINDCYAYISGGGVYNTIGAIFEMEGGYINKCEALTGGGVYNCETSSFVMSGGKITECKAVWGGGVCNAGKFTISGSAMIENCKLKVHYDDPLLGEAVFQEVNEDKITLYANGGTISGSIYNDGLAIITRSDDATEYTTFNGEITGGDIQDAAKLTVTFKCDEQTVTEKVLKGKKVEVPASITTQKNGYKFDGWYNGDEELNFSTAVTSDITLTAEFTPIVYNITYNLDGGTASNPTSYTIESDDITLSNPTKAGYTFTGWSGTGLTGDDNKTVTIAKGSTGERTYTAHWQKKSSSNTSYVQKPTLSFGDSTDVKVETAADGSTVYTTAEGKLVLSKAGTTASITPADGYEVANVSVNGTDKGAVTTLTGLKTGDKIIVTFKQTAEAQSKAEIAQINSMVEKMSLTARSTKTAKKNIKVTLKTDEETTAAIKEIKSLGYTVKYKYYRSTKKTSKYAAKVAKTSNAYTNTNGKSGTRYYYKVQVRAYDENGKCVAKTALKQCKYATRIFG